MRRLPGIARFPILLAAAFAVTLVAAAAPAPAQQLVFAPQNKSGVYEAGSKALWQIEVTGPDASAVKQAPYVLKRGGLTVMKEGTLDFSSGRATLEAALDEPGTVLAEVRTKAGDKEAKALAGAAFSPEKIRPSEPPPDDFDAFWAAKVKELNDVPASPQLDPADGGSPGVAYFKLKMDNIHGTHVYGQLAKPKKEGKFPALLIVQWAGVYGLPKGNVVGRAEHGWLALNIMAHDLPFDQPEAFYKQAAETTLKDYVSIGEDDRDKSYFLRMYLACYRAAEYLSARDDWDGKTLVVMGTSQGGQQSIVTAGLHPGITAMLANVPGGCDVTAPKVGRAAGFPYWADHAKWKKDDKILETGRYFDAAHFAARVKCPALVSLGLIDETCPPAGVFAAFNQMKGPKEVVVMPESDHHGTHNAQAGYFQRSEQWLSALQKGEPVPPK